MLKFDSIVKDCNEYIFKVLVRFLFNCTFHFQIIIYYIQFYSIPVKYKSFAHSCRVSSVPNTNNLSTIIGHMEFRPDWWNETQFLPSSNCVDTATWMHYMDADKMDGEKA